MLKIIAEYIIDGERKNLFQEVGTYNIKGLNIPNDCSIVKFWRYSVEQKEDEDRTIIITRRILEKVSYIGKELTLDELEQRYGNNSNYAILIGNVKRNNLHVVVDKMEKLHIIEHTDFEVEIIQ